MLLTTHNHPSTFPLSKPSSFDEDPCFSSDAESEGSPPPPPQDKVALVWFNRPLSGSHIAIVVGDTPHSFCFGRAVREPSSLEESCQKRIRRGDFMTVVQEIQVSPDEGKVIKALCKQNFLPSTTCMDAAAEILKTVDIHIPFPISLVPDTSRLYLDRLYHPRLKKQVSYGALRFPNLGVITQTFILLGYSYALPRWLWGANLGHQIGIATLVVLSYLQVKAFYQLRNIKIK